jgi:acetyl esterase/lipase
MSVQAFVLRAYLRSQFKHKSADVTLEQARANLELLAGKSPPPTRIRTTTSEIAGVPCDSIEGRTTDPERVLLYLHGGGYCMGSPHSHRDLTWRLAEASGARVVAPDYALAPEHPFPAALDQAVAVYKALLDDGISPENLAIGGDSAGGGLTFATLVAARDKGLPMPAAAVTLSPWTDLAGTGRSMATNAKADAMIRADQIGRIVPLYTKGRAATDPLVSPLYADLQGLPPILIQVGSTEVLLDDSTRIAEKLEEADVPVTLDVWPNMPHVWQLFAARLPEGREAVARIGAFLRDHLGRPAEAQAA